jgi:hypothetical protein
MKHVIRLQKILQIFLVRVAYLTCTSTHLVIKGLGVKLSNKLKAIQDFIFNLVHQSKPRIIFLFALSKAVELNGYRKVIP